MQIRKIAKIADDFYAQIALLFGGVDDANAGYDAGEHSRISSVSGCKKCRCTVCHRANCASS